MNNNKKNSLSNTLTGIAVLFAIIIGFSINTDAKSIGQKINRIEDYKIIENINNIRIAENADISQIISNEIKIDQDEISINSVIEKTSTIETSSKIDDIAINPTIIAINTIQRIDKIINDTDGRIINEVSDNINIIT